MNKRSQAYIMKAHRVSHIIIQVVQYSMCPNISLRISAKVRGDVGWDKGYDPSLTSSPRSESSSIPRLDHQTTSGRILNLRMLTWKLSPDWMKTDIRAPMRLAH